MPKNQATRIHVKRGLNVVVFELSVFMVKMHVNILLFLRLYIGKLNCKESFLQILHISKEFSMVREGNKCLHSRSLVCNNIFCRLIKNQKDGR